MDVLMNLAHLDIDWEADPDEVTAMYMDQSALGYALFPGEMPEDSKVRYFVVDTWELTPVVRLLERSTQWLKQLAFFPLPDEFIPALRKEVGLRQGIYAPPPEVQAWLKACMSKYQ